MSLPLASAQVFGNHVYSESLICNEQVIRHWICLHGHFISRHWIMSWSFVPYRCPQSQDDSSLIKKGLIIFRYAFSIIWAISIFMLELWYFAYPCRLRIAFKSRSIKLSEIFVHLLQSFLYVYFNTDDHFFQFRRHYIF